MSARYVSAKVRRKQERKQKTQLLEEMRQWVDDPLDVAALRELLQESLRGFAVEAGTRVALCLLQDEVLQLCGPEYQRQPGRELTRYGRQPGVVFRFSSRVCGTRMVAARRRSTPMSSCNGPKRSRRARWRRWFVACRVATTTRSWTRRG